jgi:hypothetical protein
MNGNISACRPSKFSPVHIAASHHAISAQSAPHNNLACALRPPDEALWAAAYDSDLDRNDKLGLWPYEFPRSGDTNSPVLATRLVQCYALLRMGPLSISCAECSISCGKVDCDRVNISRSDGYRPLKLSSGCDCIVEEDGESSRHVHSRE